jgi:hypothetical protein
LLGDQTNAVANDREQERRRQTTQLRTRELVEREATGAGAEERDERRWLALVLRRRWRRPAQASGAADRGPR